MARPRGDGRGRIGGKKKGYKFPSTLAKEAAAELVRQKVTEHLDGLLDGAIANAKGLSFLVVRERATGKFLRVGRDGAKGAVERLKAGEVLTEVWEKDPSIEALKELLNRALDKPRERVEATVMTDEWEKRVAILTAPRGKAKVE